jgi:transmembrane sensor
MEHPARLKLNTQIYEEACEWFIECRAGDLDDATRVLFDDWLRMSPEHLRAYLEIAGIWNEGPILDPIHRWDIDTLIAEASQDPDNVVALSTSALRDVTRRSVPPTMQQDASATRPHGEVPSMHNPIVAKRQRFLAIAASIVTLSLAVGTLTWIELFRMPTYVTAIGEQRSVLLDDGSRVTLNTASRLEVDLRKDRRLVRLLEGEALFDVTHDAARPFTVRAANVVLSDVGTQFNVYLRPSRTTVTVVEGRVAVDTERAVENQDEKGIREASTRGPLILAASDGAVITALGVAATQHGVDVAAAIAWTRRQLIFERRPLGEVAEEFNRYNRSRIAIDSPELQRQEVTGVFQAKDPASFIAFLSTIPGVEIHKDQDGTLLVTIHKKAANLEIQGAK